MKIARIEPPKPGGPYERSVRELTKSYPQAESDITTEFAALATIDVPCPPRASLIPGHAGKALKVRVPSSDMQRGRSGAFRVILWRVRDNDWRPIIAYAKSDRVDVSREEIFKAVRGEAVGP